MWPCNLQANLKERKKKKTEGSDDCAERSEFFAMFEVKSKRKEKIRL